MYWLLVIGYLRPVGALLAACGRGMAISITAHDHFVRDIARARRPMTKPSSMTRHAGLSESTIPTYAMN